MLIIINKLAKFLIVSFIVGLVTNGLAITCPDPHNTSWYSMQKQGWKLYESPAWSMNMVFKQANWAPMSKDKKLHTVICYYQNQDNNKIIAIYPNKFVRKPEWKSAVGNNLICKASQVTRCVFNYGA